MRKIFLFLIINAVAITVANAQYQQPEHQKYPPQQIFPVQPFDAVAAKNALAKGSAVIQGVAFTKPKTQFGYKAPLAQRIYANHIVVSLFPYTPYFEEWYNLKKEKENVKKNKIVYMDSVANQYKLTCETNSTGEFSFPNMKPGKYIILGTLPWDIQGSYNQYTGSGYDNYGGQTDYYQRQYYTVSHSDFLMDIIEVPQNTDVVKVKLN